MLYSFEALFFFVLVQKRKKKSQGKANAPRLCPPTRSNDWSPHSITETNVWPEMKVKASVTWKLMPPPALIFRRRSICKWNIKLAEKKALKRNSDCSGSKYCSPSPHRQERPTLPVFGNFQSASFSIGQSIQLLAATKSKKQRNSITHLITHERPALRIVQHLEFRVPVRLRKLPRSGKFPFEPAWFFCFFFYQEKK